MNDHYIKHYPVANGDTTLISLTDDAKILIDINITEDSTDEEIDHRYNVKEDLLRELQKDGNIPFVDAFILTHPDNDHCRGFQKIYHCGAPDEYSKTSLDEELIRIDELWFSPRIFIEYHSDLNEDAKAFKKEAQRRIELHKKNKQDKDKPGNRIKIIGYSDDAELSDLEHLIVTPGQYISSINGSTKKDFSFFVHAPFKRDIDDNEERNDTSIVLHARFDVDRTQRAGLVMLGGDAGSEIWRKIWEISKSENLEWDIFLAPHHCSWKFFNVSSHEDDSKPEGSSINILNKLRTGAYVISSSRGIDALDDKLPPHQKAKKEYEKIVGANNFMITSDYKDGKNPVPIVFRFTANGPQRLPVKKAISAARSALIGEVTNRPSTYGRK